MNTTKHLRRSDLTHALSRCVPLGVSQTGMNDPETDDFTLLLRSPTPFSADFEAKFVACVHDLQKRGLVMDMHFASTEACRFQGFNLIQINVAAAFNPGFVRQEDDDTWIELDEQAVGELIEAMVRNEYSRDCTTSVVFDTDSIMVTVERQRAPLNIDNDEYLKAQLMNQMQKIHPDVESTSPRPNTTMYRIPRKDSNVGSLIEKIVGQAVTPQNVGPTLVFNALLTALGKPKLSKIKMDYNYDLRGYDFGFATYDACLNASEDALRTALAGLGLVNFTVKVSHNKRRLPHVRNAFTDIRVFVPTEGNAGMVRGNEHD